ncbi:MAG: hypothetical protein EZS28_022255 [Streblomastix strix]|uniref:Uncharacterized protein n=1 Tax=Streblomastix strix TaxID=222440 RepID=A0A5J4VI08_9EUKA|nr:MAG: hypothetical protein EZS28_022255 [Streblomastix strix]
MKKQNQKENLKEIMNQNKVILISTYVLPVINMKVQMIMKGIKVVEEENENIMIIIIVLELTLEMMKQLEEMEDKVMEIDSKVMEIGSKVMEIGSKVMEMNEKEIMMKEVGLNVVILCSIIMIEQEKEELVILEEKKNILEVNDVVGQINMYEQMENVMEMKKKEIEGETSIGGVGGVGNMDISFEYESECIGDCDDDIGECECELILVEDDDDDDVYGWFDYDYYYYYYQDGIYQQFGLRGGGGED